MQPYLIVLIVVAALLVITFLLALTLDKLAYGRRCDKIPFLKYFSAEDFNLSAESVSLPHGLKGCIYRSEKSRNDGKIIVFCHGMGPGHVAYTTEIAYFCSLGYPVLAVDNRGCNLSSGKSIRGMYSGIQAAIAAIDYCYSFFLLSPIGQEDVKPNLPSPIGQGGGVGVRVVPRIQPNVLSPKIYLVGHSWGAYSALCASSKRKVAGVVAVSAPNIPSESTVQLIKKPSFAVLRPFWWVINLFKFGASGNLRADKCAEKSGVPTLLIHGDRDEKVPLPVSAFNKAEGAHITKLLARGKAHNPYNTENAEKLLSELSARLHRGERDLSDFDFVAATEEDEEVMTAISSFIENN